ncbi:EAL domain-containing protein [Rubrobacter indicoceani]|uniref:sensor domain-containing protein n=1 Tax=Rubrobacter indicoceani TaxID=2051957 RepID=UPI000E5A2BF2|nr:EAL domain-containing protein [Rubrobacter indicoceani]
MLLHRRRERSFKKRLSESEGRLKKLVDGMADALIVSTPEGRVLDVNRQAELSLGYTRAEMIGGSLCDFEVGFVPQKRSRSWNRLVSGGQVLVQGVYRCKSGRTFPTEATITLYELDGKPVVLSVVRDVSEREKALQEVRIGRERTEAMLRAVPDAVCRVDRNGRYLDVAAGEPRSLFRLKETVIGSTIPEVLGEEVGERFMRKLSRALETGELQTIEYPLVSYKGEQKQIEARIAKSGRDEAVYFARDITGRHEMQRRIEESEARSRAIVEAVPDLIFRFDRDGKCLELHADDEKFLLRPREQLIGHNIREVLPAVALKLYEQAYGEAILTGETQVFEYEVPRKKVFRHREVRVVASRPSGEAICFVRNIDERREFESRIHRLAYLDDLTGLPNRTAFVEELEAALSDPDRRPSAVILLNLRDFARVNGSLGREAGDRLIRIFAERGQRYLKGCAPRSFFARLWGNEFAVLLENTDLAQSRSLIEVGLEEYLDRPFRLDTTEVFLKPNVGMVAISSGDDPKEIMRRVSVALREAQRDADSLYKVYSREMGERSVYGLKLERDLRQAIEDGEIGVYYQPEVFLQDGQIYSLEALARWKHPQYGQISPAEFIPLAEETGLILALGDHVLSEACRRMSEWCRRLPHLSPCTVSVNVSTLQLCQTGFVEKVARTLRKNGLSPERLQLEITESAAVADFEASVRVFNELRELGVRIALDDFGTGYSSLSYLRRFSLDALKLDRSFIFEVSTDRSTAQVVSSIVNIAHALKLCVVGEGIETTEQLEALDLLNCDIGQGYLFSRPIPADETFTLLKGWTKREGRHPRPG